MRILSDEGKQLEYYEKGKIFRVQRDSYPTDHDGKFEAVQRALERLGEKNYRVPFNNCEHLVTHALTGIATCQQLKSKTGLAIVVDEWACKFHIKIVVEVVKALPSVLTKLGKISTPVLKKEFMTLFASFFDEGVEYMVTGAVSSAAKEAGGIATRSCINLGSAAGIELVILIIHTVGDLFMYKKKKKSAEEVAQNFLRGIVGVVGTSLGTFLGGLILGTVFAFVGLAPLGLTIGNIVGGVVGNIAARKLGNNWLTGGRIEAKLIKFIKAKFKPFKEKPQALQASKSQELLKHIMSSQRKMAMTLPVI